MYYVGSTLDVSRRWPEHLYALQNGHHNAKMQAAWDDSCPSDWEWQVLESDIPATHQFIAEQHWIDALDAHANGYNQAPRAGSFVSLSGVSGRGLIAEREDEILEILQQLEDGNTYRDIAKQHSVSLATVCNLRYRYWDLLPLRNERDECGAARAAVANAAQTVRWMNTAERDMIIEDMLQSGYTYRAIAKEAKCSIGTVSRIAHIHDET